ncbi:MAG: hypothetical protein CMJ58_07790 [Planctomycetaceae bacterium]|nr:hypothetical protein [Planctomycetaceae bacterium]
MILATVAVGSPLRGVAAGTVIDAGEFGLSELKPGEDATSAFRKAIEACRDRGASGLRIPPGVWHLYPDAAFERTLAVANNNPGVKRVAFLLDGLEDFTLAGDQALLMCHGEMIPISADNAVNLSLRGVSIDWEHPFHFQGEVVALHPEVNAFDLQTHPETIYEIRNERLVFREKPSASPDAWKEWAPPPTERLSWEHNLQWNMWFDGATNEPIPGEHQWALAPDPRVKEITPGVIRLFDATDIMPQLGWVVAVKGMGSPNRTSPAIRVARSKNLKIDDVTIRHAGGMGIIVQRTVGATLRDVHVELPEKRGRVVTTTADATHFNGCRGEIVLEDCSFANMLDDAANVHGCFVRVERTTGPRTLICRRVHSQQRGLIVMESGDKVRFVTSDDLQPYGDAVVTSTRELNSDLFEVKLDRLPSGGVRTPSGLYNLTWQPSLVVRRCTVRNNRARVMLIATAGRVVVEDNVFENSSMAGVQFEGDNGFWWESGPARDVLIRRNVFRNLAGPALRIAADIDPQASPDAYYHGGICFENNVIETKHRRIVEGWAIDGLTFRGNIIKAIADPSAEDDSTVSFQFKSGRQIVIAGNAYDGESPLTVHAGTRSAEPKMDANRGIRAWAK